jgi:hypothetical protein
VKRQKKLSESEIGLKRKYFISFSGLINKISKGELHLDSLFLNKPLFAFSCTRDYFFAYSDYETISIVQLVSLRRAVLLGENQKRVVWRTFRETNMSFEKLLTLLPIDEQKEVIIPQYNSYSHQVVEEILPNYDVIF